MTHCVLKVLFAKITEPSIKTQNFGLEGTFYDDGNVLYVQ